VTRDQDVGYQGGLTRPLTPREPTGRIIRADAGTRTPDPFITSEVLYQLSYVGVCPAKEQTVDGWEAEALPLWTHLWTHPAPRLGP
jgi:hypothetical protein